MRVYKYTDARSPQIPEIKQDTCYPSLPVHTHTHSHTCIIINAYIITANTFQPQKVVKIKLLKKKVYSNKYVPLHVIAYMLRILHDRMKNEFCVSPTELH